MLNEFDVWIVGAGPTGCVIAEKVATELNLKCLIIEKRNHIAGNCYDRFHESGVFIHQYGPHYFRTNNASLIKYLSQFTDWLPANYQVKSSVNGSLYSFPINLITLEQFFGKKFNADSAERFLKKIRKEYSEPRNSEEFVLSRVGKKLYEAFYLNYTLKQWDQHPRNLDPSVCGRIPIRFNRDERYVDHQFQSIPRHGFTAMFQKMITHKNIHTLLQTDYQEIRNFSKPKLCTIYCGPIDEYFNYKLGKLPWRSIHFNFKVYNQEYKQPCVQINFPNEYKYTRTVEIKHITAQKHPHTVISYEYPRALGDPYYPVPNRANSLLYNEYEKLANQETRNSRVLFCGRLAKYKYINTDEALDAAIMHYHTVKEWYNEWIMGHHAGL